MTDTLKPWTFYWLTGRKEVLRGESPEGALNRAGYGRGALAALDFYAEGDQDGEYVWNADSRSWDRTDADEVCS